MVSSGPRTQPPGAAVAATQPLAGPVATARLSDLPVDRMPQRTEDHVVMLVTAGQGTHALDFVTYACRPGTLLWGRPGQVHQFGGQTGFDATVLAFSHGILPALPEIDGLRELVADPLTATCWQPAGEDEEAIVAEIAQVGVDQVRYGGTQLGAALLAHSMAVLLMRIVALAPPPPAGPAALLLGLLRSELERDVTHRRVEEYAEALRCSVRTLTRASLAVTGRSAKQIIDERIALEAKRLLATGDDPVADVGRRLGFDEPTNFGRFFARETGQSPGAFRAALRRSPAPRVPHQRSALPGRLTPRSA
ncbi:AraC family transcriptional regulator [Dactylosporangium sp. AC04546]|uniref:helix-turn-helix domain-containing protein n=1 Tax=Dactylosporangium sp. AC04546 TaxID=2862460 RepID=UPI001EDD3608|nr:AraC family transcriptional regulator [Dactylosporangium sp. AC04546]WVK85719.1 AraC family transcriptional regulator [Dactylosporangium sp. AC04546]